MFEKGSDVKQSNGTEKCTTRNVHFSVENNVQTACDYHDLNMNFVV